MQVAHNKIGTRFQTLYKMVMLAQLDKELVVKVAVEAGACPKCALRYHIGFS